MNGKPYTASLRKKLALIVILVSLTPLTLITGVMGYYFETSYRNGILKNLHAMLERDQQQINLFLGETLSAVQFIASSTQYDELAKAGYLQRELSMLQSAYPGVFVDLGVVNSAGKQISYAGKLQLLDANYAKTDWFREAMKRDYFVSDVFRGLRRERHFVISVRGKGKNSEWLLRATVNFADFNSLVEGIRVGQTGSVFIVDSKGDLQSQPRTALIPDIAALLRITPWADGEEKTNAGTLASGAPGITVMSQQSNALMGAVQNHNGKVLFILVPLKSGEWTLVYQQQWDDAFLEIDRARVIALAIFFAGCFAVLLAAFFISRKVVRRIEEAEFEKERMNQQVTEAQRLASIGELAAGVAHEINNPVAIMIEQAGWMEDLLEEELEGSRNLDELKHSLKQIAVQGVRCKDITHKLLSFAHRRAGTIHDQIRLNDTVGEILSVYKASPKFNGIHVETNLDRNLPLVLASPTEMQELFMNLINNAIDAMSPAGGTLGIRSRVEGNDVVVEISDTGHGMDKSVMARIFDPFFTTKRAGQGTGLGLPICYRIVKNLGGRLSVDSKVGFGTTFYVHIPIPTAKDVAGNRNFVSGM